MRRAKKGVRAKGLERGVKAEESKEMCRCEQLRRAGNILVWRAEGGKKWGKG